MYNLAKQIKNGKGKVVIEEYNIYCNLGSILARFIAENNPKPMKFVGINNSFCESGKREEILNINGLNIKNIKDIIHFLIKKI